MTEERPPVGAAGATVDAEASFIYLIHPFDLGAPFAGIARSAADAGWRAASLPLDEALPHLHAGSGADGMEGALVQSWTAPIGLLADSAAADPVCRVFSDLREPLEFELTEATLVGFRDGVGFMRLGVRPRGTRADDWYDFVACVRVAGERPASAAEASDHQDSPTAETVVMQRRCGGVCSACDEPAPGADGQWQDCHRLRRLWEALAAQALGAPPGEHFYLKQRPLIYASLVVDGEDQAAQPEVLFRLRNLYLAQKSLRPTAADLAADQAGQVEVRSGQWRLSSLAGSVRVDFNAPKGRSWDRTAHPRRLQTHYLFCFLLVLHQRFALHRLSHNVAKGWRDSNPRRRREAFATNRQALLDFTACGYFSQAMQLENVHREYQRWQAIYGVHELFEEVRAEIREIHEALEADQDRALQVRLNEFGAYLGLPAVVFAWFALVCGSLHWWYGLVVGLASVGLARLALPYLHQGRERPGGPRS